LQRPKFPKFSGIPTITCLFSFRVGEMFPLQLFGARLCASFSGTILEQGSGLSELQEEGVQEIQGRSMCGDNMRRHLDVSRCKHQNRH